VTTLTDDIRDEDENNEAHPSPDDGSADPEDEGAEDEVIEAVPYDEPPIREESPDEGRRTGGGNGGDPGQGSGWPEGLPRELGALFGMQGGPQQPPRQRSVFRFRPPTMWSGRLRLLMMVALGYWALVSVPSVFGGTVGWWTWAEVIVIPLFIVGNYAWRWFRLPDEVQEVRLEDDALYLPKGPDVDSVTKVDYTELRAIMPMRRGTSEMILIDTESGRFIYSADDFQDPNAPQLIREAFGRKIAEHPKGESIRQRLQKLEHLSRSIGENDTQVTFGLLGLIVAIYGIEYMTGALQGYNLLRFGANSAPLIDAGQWWRLISGNFLHGGFVHILFNGIALFFLGLYIERLLGSWRFLGIFLLSAVGGALGSYWFTEAPMSVGSSTALFGLIAAFGVIHIKYWRDLPPPYRQSIQWWVFILTANVGISFVPFIDTAGHFGGLLTGAVVTVAATAGMSDFDPTKEAPGWWQGLTGVSLLVFAVAGGLAISHAIKDPSGDLNTLLTAQYDRAQAQGDARSLNETAWLFATQKNVDTSQLELALKSAQQAVEIDSVPAYRDTLATVHYRLGLRSSRETRRRHLADAVEIERGVLKAVREGEPQGPSEGMVESVSREMWSTSEGYYATQFGRFLEAYTDDFGRYTLGEVPDDPIEVSLTRRAGKPAIEVDLKRARSEGVELYALAFRENRRIGVAHLCVAAGQRGATLQKFAGQPGSVPSDESTHVRIGFVATEQTHCEAGETSAAWWSTSQEVARLP
jgi:rhomboid protease GluP